MDDCFSLDVITEESIGWKLKKTEKEPTILPNVQLPNMIVLTKRGCGDHACAFSRYSRERNLQRWSVELAQLSWPHRVDLVDQDDRHLAEFMRDSCAASLTSPLFHFLERRTDSRARGCRSVVFKNRTQGSTNLGPMCGRWVVCGWWMRALCQN